MKNKISFKKTISLIIFGTLFLIISLYFGLSNFNNDKNINNTTNELLNNKENSNVSNSNIPPFEYGLFSVAETSYYFFDNGAIYTWGSNQYGQAGIGTNDFTIGTPMLVNDLWGFDATDIDAFFTDGFTTIVFLNDNTIHAWGLNSAGQLGLGDYINRTSPVQVEQIWNISPNEIEQFYLDRGTIITFLTTNNEIWGWGRNGHRTQLGIGGVNHQSSPVQLDTIWGFDSSQIEKFFFRTFASYVFLDDNTIHAWGENDFGELGIGNTNDHTTPTRVDDNWNFNASDISETYFVEYGVGNGISEIIYNIVLLTNGEYWGWGNNIHGQLGASITNVSGVISSPILLTSHWGTSLDTTKITNIYAYSHNVFIFLDDGSIYGMGDNSYSQLGVGTTNSAYVPLLLNNTWNFDAYDIDNFVYYNASVYAFLSDGSIYVWGKNNEGQLGIGDLNNINRPLRINSHWGFDSDEVFKFFNINFNETVRYNFVILNNGSFLGWGNNGTLNNLGINGAASNLTTPTILFQFANFEYFWNDDDLTATFNYDKGYWGEEDIYYTLHNITNLTEEVASTLVPNLNFDGTQTTLVINDIVGLDENDSYQLHFTPNATTHLISPGFVLKNDILLDGNVSSVKARNITRTSAIIDFYYTDSYASISGISEIDYTLDNGLSWFDIPGYANTGLNTFELTNLDPSIGEYNIRVAPKLFINNFAETTIVKPAHEDSVISNVSIETLSSNSVEINYDYDRGTNGTGKIQYSLNGEPWITSNGFSGIGTNTLILRNLTPETSYYLIIAPEDEGLYHSDDTNFTTTAIQPPTSPEPTPETDSSSWWDDNAWWVIIVAIVGGIILGFTPYVINYIKTMKTKKRLE